MSYFGNTVLTLEVEKTGEGNINYYLVAHTIKIKEIKVLKVCAKIDSSLLLW